MMGVGSTRGEGGDSNVKRSGMLVRKLNWIKETNLGMARALFDP